MASSSSLGHNSISDYVAKALRLGNDKAYRDKVGAAIFERAPRIGDDKQVNFEWLRFLWRVLDIEEVDADQLMEMAGWERIENWQTDEFNNKLIQQQQQRWKLRE